MTKAERLDEIIKPSRKDDPREKFGIPALIMSILRNEPEWNQFKESLAVVVGN